MQQAPCSICLLALIGLPAAGKSTFSRWLLQLPQTHFNVIHLCYDEHLKIPQAVGVGVFDYKSQRLEIYKVLEELVEALKECGTLPRSLESQLKVSNIANSKQFLIICDDNNYYRSMRYKLYQFCRSHQCAYAQIYFDCAPATALQRNAARGAAIQVPQHILTQMAVRLEAPAAQQHHWESGTLTLYTEQQQQDFSSVDIMPFLCQAFESAVPPLVDDCEEQQTAQSMLHQLDLLLRRRLRELLQNGAPVAAEKQARAVALNAKRKQILLELKAFDIAGGLCAADLIEYVNLLQ